MAEGRKNQLREMFFRIENPVIKLKRVAMGPVKLGELRPGESRPLTRDEVESLKEAAGLSVPAKAKAPERRGSGWARPRPRTTQRREKEGSR